jgi:hypothetical protein
VDANVSEQHTASIFRAENVGNIFLRNVGIYLQVHTASQPRRLPWTTDVSTITFSLTTHYGFVLTSCAVAVGRMDCTWKFRVDSLGVPACGVSGYKCGSLMTTFRSAGIFVFCSYNFVPYCGVWN